MTQYSVYKSVCGGLFAISWSGGGLVMGHHLPFLISTYKSYALRDYFPSHPPSAAVGVEGPDPACVCSPTCSPGFTLL